MITEQDINRLEQLYFRCKAYHGELHDHASTGGTSDGKCTLSHWIEALASLKMDFAAILDHRQVQHMYLPEWRDGLFIGGTEPGTTITDSKAEVKHMHYNMLFSGPKELENLLEEFPEYEFTGGQEGHFIYPPFTTARFCELIDAVKAHGGFFVYPHPKQLMVSDDPCDYWFSDETGIEVFYVSMDSEYTEANYKLWVDLLAKGKRVWACAGGDLHSEAVDTALTTIFAESNSNASYLSHLRAGDFTCGSAGIRMCIGDTKSGGQCSFGGKKLVVCISDFHDSVIDPTHEYRVDIINNNGTVISEGISCNEASYFAVDAEDCDFYRAEVFDVTRDLRIAVGNPIWNVRT